MRLRAFALLALAACASTVHRSAARSDVARAESDEGARADVLAVVRRLFDAMRTGDSAALRSTLAPEVVLVSVTDRPGAPPFVVDSMEAFVRAVGTPHPEVWDERTSNEIVHVDGRLAVVWADYAFYLGSRFMHCGVDTFQLVRMPAGWKIVALADTRRREGCTQ